MFYTRPELSLSTLKEYMGLHSSGKSYNEVQNDTHHALCAIGANWLVRKHKCRSVLVERGGSGLEMPDVLGFYYDASYLIEAKVSKQDFKIDKLKPFRSAPETGMGKYRYFICPKGLIAEAELPQGWGLLYVTDKGIVKLVKESEEHVRNKDAEYLMLTSALATPWKLFGHWTEKALERLFRLHWIDSGTEVDLKLFAARLHINRLIEVEENE